MSIHQVYFDITRKAQEEYGDKTVVFIQVGSFFEVYGVYDKLSQTFYGSKLYEVSKICDLAIPSKQYSVNLEQFNSSLKQKGTLHMCGFQPMLFERYLSKLEEEGYTILIYVQSESTTMNFHNICPEWFLNMEEKINQARKNSKSTIPQIIETEKGSIRLLVETISPGSSVHYNDTRHSNFIAALWISKNKGFRNKQAPKMIIGVGMCNVFTSETQVYEFCVPWNITPALIEPVSRILNTYQPREYIFVYENDKQEYLENYLGINQETSIHRYSYESHPFVQQFEKQIIQKDLLSRWYDIHDYSSFKQSTLLNEMPFGTMAFCTLLNFLQEHNAHLVHQLSPPQVVTDDTVMLANHSLQQLNIINAGDKRRISSVEQWMNRCCTTIGKRKLYERITNPITNVLRLREWYSISNELYSENVEQYRKELDNIRDLERDYRQIVLNKITPRNLGEFCKSIEMLDDIMNKQIYRSEIWNKLLQYETNTDNIREIREITTDLNEHFRKYISIEDCIMTNGFYFERNIFNRVEGNIGIQELCDVDEQYLESLEELDKVKKIILQIMQDYEKSSRKNVEYCKIHETDKKIFLVMTKKRFQTLKKHISKNKKELKRNDMLLTEIINELNSIPDIGGKSSCAITTPRLSQLCREIGENREKRTEYIRREYYQFLSSMNSSLYRNSIEKIVGFIGIIDIIWNNIYMSKKYNYCCPTIDERETSYIQAKQLRHILIEQIQEDEIYVPNDITIDETRGFLVFGTNAVGKSSLIRSVGISVILAQAGLFVPCREFTFSPFSRIFTRILGNDNIFKGLSTFMVEMTELNTILNNANSNSLVLGDELCSGTEIPSAISIFLSALEELYKHNSCFMFATHFHELTRMKEIEEMKTIQLVHLSVIYDAENDCLVYERKLKDGSGKTNYGLEVCRSIHMPSAFLERANQIRMKLVPEERGIMGVSKTRYNSKKLKSVKCEVCQTEITTEVHHLTPQECSNSSGMIDESEYTFHKNHPANLISVCHKCHSDFHNETDTRFGHRRIKTTKGYKIVSR